MAPTPRKKARVNVVAKPKPNRKGTPPPAPKLQHKLPTFKPAAQASDKKNKVTVSAKPKDSKGKAKATSYAVDEADVTVASLPTSFKVIAGSYEKLLYGLEGSVSVEEGSHKFSLKPVFIFPAHISCVKAVAASPNGGKWLATGSADEIVKVWDLRRRKEIGGLMHHEGSITQLEFPSRSHLLSASEDGTLCLFRARDWAVLRSLRGHKGRVNSVAVHPSGKVALSVGKDRTMRMWDLMRGKGVASTKLGKEGELVRWSIDGSMFIVQTLSDIDVYSTDMVLLHTIHHGSRLHDIKFCKRVEGKGEVFLAAAEDKKVSVYQVSNDTEKAPTIIAEMVGHDNRVKAVDTLRIALPSLSEASRNWTTLVSTISSNGRIRLYDLAAVPNEAHAEVAQLSPLTEYDTKGSRLTCMAMADGDVAPSAANGKRKREAEETHTKDEEDEAEEWAPQTEQSQDEGEEEDESENEEEDEIEAEED